MLEIMVDSRSVVAAPVHALFDVSCLVSSKDAGCGGRLLSEKKMER